LARFASGRPIATFQTVTPTRFMNRETPLSEMTLEQFYIVHGEAPTRKFVPARPFGPPRSRDELRAEQHDPYRQPQYTPHPATQNRTAAPPENGHVHASGSNLPPAPHAPKIAKARLAVPLGVSPTDPTYMGGHTTPPCRAVMELEVEVDELGLVLYPVSCEVIGEHPNQPHMTRIPGRDPDNPRRALDVFVGWADALPS
jgi:hypothetical protein